MKYALIGCGRIAINHVIAAVNNKLDFVAVCDVLPEAMENLLAKKELNKEESINRYTDYKEMLAKEQPELVSIATESGLHAEIALYCIEHGVNVIIEKPMAMNIDDAQSIIDLAKEKGVIRIALILQFRSFVKLLMKSVLASFPMVLFTFAGTAMRTIISRPHGEVLGLRMAGH